MTTVVHKPVCPVRITPETPRDKSKKMTDHVGNPTVANMLPACSRCAVPLPCINLQKLKLKRNFYAHAL